MIVNQKIPNLRFPEFDGEWEDTFLDSIGEYIGGGTPKTSIQEYWQGEIPWISSSDIIENDIHNINIQKYITEDAVINSATKKIPARSLIIVSRVGVGKFAINSSEVCTSQDFTNIIIDKDLYNPNFAAYNLYKNIEVLFNISQGTSIKGFTITELKKTKLPFPTLPEQTKIASFLTAVDNKLHALKQKHALLEQYKKGVMQKIFTQELRFKPSPIEALEIGGEYPDWEEKKLGEVAEKRIIKNRDNKINLVFTNSAVQGIVNQRDFFDKDIANQNNLLGYYIVEKDDFVYNPRISTNAPVGPISRNHLDTGIMSPLYSVFRFKYGNFDFIEYFFNSSVWHLHMKNISNYGARDDRMSFSTSDFYKMPIPFPCSKEQTKIASFLSAIDEKINQCQVQIAKTEVWKKGLLQQLFV